LAIKPTQTKERKRNMKYIKAVDLWDAQTQEAILVGKVKLQRGQWVKCGSSKLSRYVKTTGRSLWIAHPQENAKATLARFNQLCAAA
jgi:hypothetical protein